MVFSPNFPGDFFLLGAISRCCSSLAWGKRQLSFGKGGFSPHPTNSGCPALSPNFCPSSGNAGKQLQLLLKARECRGWSIAAVFRRMDGISALSEVLGMPAWLSRLPLGSSSLLAAPRGDPGNPEKGLSVLGCLFFGNIGSLGSLRSLGSPPSSH